ncbi:MAG TPA: universal stress protein [Chitinophagales bacterium]|nr:universal stress protein [Chitinophagales bacterium]
MNTILVPTDFSDTARKAVEVAKEIARKTKATIHLANFYAVRAADYAYPDISMPEQIMEEMRKAALEGMSALVGELEAEGFSAESTIRMGMATDSIIELAEEAAVDLIVMGTTGAGSLVNKIIGSNAEHVMSNTKTPIILVPADCSFDGIYQMVYADRLTEDATPVLTKVFGFASQIGAHNVSILNVNTQHHYEPVNEHVLLQLGRVFGHDRVKLTIVDADSVKEGIDKYLDHHNIDLVVMSTHKKTLLERIFNKSNTKMMALYSKVPVMVYHVD